MPRMVMKLRGPILKHSRRKNRGKLLHTLLIFRNNSRLLA